MKAENQRLSREIKCKHWLEMECKLIVNVVMRSFDRSIRNFHKKQCERRLLLRFNIDIINTKITLDFFGRRYGWVLIS